MTYTHTTYPAFRTLLADAVSDPDKVHWIDDELGMYAVEAIRFYNSLTGLHRSIDSFSTTPGVAFYDLTSVLPNNELDHTITDNALIALAQYSLMEPKSPTVWTGSEMWVLSSFIAALQRRRDLFLFDTGSTLTQHSIITSNPDIDLPESVMAVRRAVWRTPENRYYSLWPSDDSLAIHSDSQPGIPSSYSISSISASRLRLFPAPASIGTLELLTLDTGATIDPTANSNAGTPLGIPNDLAWGVRFGMMSDLLYADGPSRDPARAAICEEMYALAVEIGRQLPTILSLYIDGRRITPTTLAKLDGLYPGWQGRTPDIPTQVAIVGPTLLAIHPVPDSSPHSITVEYVRNAITPAASTDYIQVGREDLDALLSWAHLLASFKSQGTTLHSARFRSQLTFSRALAYNEQRILQSTYLSELAGLASSERRDRPYYRSTNLDSGNASEGDRSDRGDTASSHQTRDRSRLLRSRQVRLGGR